MVTVSWLRQHNQLKQLDIATPPAHHAYSFVLAAVMGKSPIIQ